MNVNGTVEKFAYDASGHMMEVRHEKGSRQKAVNSGQQTIGS